MKILLVGGGTGGHITPLLAVARELKAAHPNITLVAVCEKSAQFANLYHDEPAIDAVRQVCSGKLRRYGGYSLLKQLLDVQTNLLNVRDVFYTVAGYFQARTMLKKEQPNGIIFKGGYIGVPVGLAAAHLGIPFITHDSDTVPGLANRIISRKAIKNATGMPAEFYTYPKDKLCFTGIPVSKEYKHVTPALLKQYLEDLGLNECKQVITIIGGSQGAEQLNEDMLKIAGRLMQHHENLGIVHIVGIKNEKHMKQSYAKELLADERKRVVVKGFVDDGYRCMGAADVVVSRSSATITAELAILGKATIMVPGQLAGDHQTVNARHLADSGAALFVPNADSEGLYAAIHSLLTDTKQAKDLAQNLHAFAKPNAARELAELAMSVLSKTSVAGGAKDEDEKSV